MSNFSEQELVRREKLKKIIDLGINPYPAETFPVSHLAVEIKENFKEGEVVKIAGRVMSRRIQGKASFAEIQTVVEKFKFISTETKYALRRTNRNTMNFIKNFLILEIF